MPGAGDIEVQTSRTVTLAGKPGGQDAVSLDHGALQGHGCDAIAVQGVIEGLTYLRVIEWLGGDAHREVLDIKVRPDAELPIERVTLVCHPLDVSQVDNCNVDFIGLVSFDGCDGQILHASQCRLGAVVAFMAHK